MRVGPQIAVLLSLLRWPIIGVGGETAVAKLGRRRVGMRERMGKCMAGDVDCCFGMQVGI